MAEDAEAALDQPVLRPVPLAVLSREKPDDRLSDGQPHLAHVCLIQAWAGSSQISHRRSPGPAITLR